MGVESPPGTGRKGRQREGGRVKGMEVQRSQVLLLAGFRGIWVPCFHWSLLGALGALRDVPGIHLAGKAMVEEVI